MLEILFIISIKFHNPYIHWKSREYYEQTVIHILTESNSSHQKQVFEQEIKYLFYQLTEKVLNQLRNELLEKWVIRGKFI